MVALHVRAWVEISRVGYIPTTVNGRPPCEGVGRNFREAKQRLWAFHVALHVRAWVEIVVLVGRKRVVESPSM